MPEQSEEKQSKIQSMVTKFKLTTADWTVVHWAATASLVTFTLGVLDRLRGKKPVR